MRVLQTLTGLTSQVLCNAVCGGEGEAHQAEGEAVLRHHAPCGNRPVSHQAGQVELIPSAVALAA